MIEFYIYLCCMSCSSKQTDSEGQMHSIRLHWEIHVTLFVNSTPLCYCCAVRHCILYYSNNATGLPLQVENQTKSDSTQRETKAGFSFLMATVWFPWLSWQLLLKAVIRSSELANVNSSGKSISGWIFMFPGESIKYVNRLKCEFDGYIHDIIMS